MNFLKASGSFYRILLILCMKLNQHMLCADFNSKLDLINLDILLGINWNWFWNQTCWELIPQFIIHSTLKCSRELMKVLTRCQICKERNPSHQSESMSFCLKIILLKIWTPAFKAILNMNFSRRVSIFLQHNRVVSIISMLLCLELNGKENDSLSHLINKFN